MEINPYVLLEYFSKTLNSICSPYAFKNVLYACVCVCVCVHVRACVCNIIVNIHIRYSTMICFNDTVAFVPCDGHPVVIDLQLMCCVQTQVYHSHTYN